MELSTEARAKSAFVTPLDKFEFTRCPFGLSQAPAYFQRLMNKVIRGLPFAFVYLDDVLIHSPDVETHLKHIKILFQRLREADLKLKDAITSKHMSNIWDILSQEKELSFCLKN